MYLRGESVSQEHMPFIALQNATRVIPEEVDDGVELECFDCGDPVKPRQSHTRGGSFVARHFWHPTGAPDECEATGGESRKHQRMKSIAASKAKARWTDAVVSLEEQIGDHRADILVSFRSFHPRFGNGIAIEVQHKHENKDLDAVETDYQAHQYSTVWLYDAHFEGKDVDLDAGDWSIWWATEVPDQDAWSGYHGIVHWLRQEQSPPVQIDIPFPADFLKSNPQLRRAFERGQRAQRQQNEQQQEEWESLVECKLTYQPAYLTLSESPTGHLYLMLSKGYGQSYEYVHAPIHPGARNVAKLRSFADSVEELGDHHDDFVDSTADDWETEDELWLDTGQRTTKSLLKTIRPPDGSLALQAKKIQDSDVEGVIVASPFDPFDVITTLGRIADELESRTE